MLYCTKKTNMRVYHLLTFEIRYFITFAVVHCRTKENRRTSHNMFKKSNNSLSEVFYFVVCIFKVCSNSSVTFIEFKCFKRKQFICIKGIIVLAVLHKIHEDSFYDFSQWCIWCAVKWKMMMIMMMTTWNVYVIRKLCTILNLKIVSCFTHKRLMYSFAYNNK